MKTNILFAIISILIITSSCKSDEQKLTEELSVMKIMQDIEGPRIMSKEISMDSIGVEVSPNPFKFISYINITQEDTNFIKTEFYNNLIENYRKNVIKDIKGTEHYELFKKNNTTLEYNVFVNKKFGSKFIIKSNEY